MYPNVEMLTTAFCLYWRNQEEGQARKRKQTTESTWGLPLPRQTDVGREPKQLIMKWPSRPWGSAQYAKKEARTHQCWAVDPASPAPTVKTRVPSSLDFLLTYQRQVSFFLPFGGMLQRATKKSGLWPSSRGHETTLWFQWSPDGEKHEYPCPSARWHYRSQPGSLDSDPGLAVAKSPPSSLTNAGCQQRWMTKTSTPTW